MEALEKEEELPTITQQPQEGQLKVGEQLNNGEEKIGKPSDKALLKNQDFQNQKNEEQEIVAKLKEQYNEENNNEEVCEENQPSVLPKTQAVPQTEVHKDYKHEAGQLLSGHRLLKTIFVHFCKQNHLSSIKSTLFQNKQRQMQLMTLSKWMVLNKQFSIYQKLCSMKGNSIQSAMDNSMVKQQRIKINKNIQKNMIGIFRKGTNNASKMNFEHFCRAILLLLEQFRPSYEQSISGLDTFLSEVFYCSSQKDCLQKLSSLKITSTIPQIDYQRPVTILSNSRTNQNFLYKQNQTQNIRVELPKSRSMIPHDFHKFALNPVIRQAKKTMLGTNNSSNHLTQKLSQHIKLRPHQTDQKPLKKTELKSDLIKFFEASQDDILESYFSAQKTQCLSK